MKRMYQIIKAKTDWPRENIGWLLVLLSILAGGLAGIVLAVLVPGLSAQILNLCALGAILGFVWSQVSLLNL